MMIFLLLRSREEEKYQEEEDQEEEAQTYIVLSYSRVAGNKERLKALLGVRVFDCASSDCGTCGGLTSLSPPLSRF